MIEPIKPAAPSGVGVDAVVMPQEWIVELYDGKQFLAPWTGDPGRTCVRESARRYKSQYAAECALREAKRRFPSRDYSLARVAVAAA